jgi:hypothetical protein
VTPAHETTPPRPAPAGQRAAPDRRALLGGGLAAWVTLVTAAHVHVNRRPAATGAAAAARSLEVGGLPVT